MKRQKKTAQQLRQERILLEKRKRIDANLLEDENDLLDDSTQDNDETPEEESSAALALKEQLDALEKDGEYYPSPMMEMGPTSWEELDASEKAREQANKLDETGWNTRSLVRNILMNHMMDPKEKAKAIQNVGAGFGERVSSIVKETATMQKDMDALVLESIIAHDKRNTNAVMRLIDKAKLSTTTRENLSDSDFALIKEEDGKKVRKYPVHDATHTRNALARAAQEINAGGQAAIDAKEAMPRIRASAKKFGIEMTMKKDKNGIVVEKDDAGDWRWVGWVSNNFEDTDHDIIAEVAHKEYVGFLDENPQMAPVFMTWHTPGTVRENLPDFWDYQSGFLVMSGKLTEKEAETLVKASTLADLGMSHLSLVFSRDPTNANVVTKYRMCEVSDLPLENAANPFTGLDTISKEAGMDKLLYLGNLLGKEKAEELLGQMSVTQKELKDAGMKSAEKGAGQTDAPPTNTPVVPEHVMKEIMARLDIPGLSEFVAGAQEALEKVPLLEKAIEALAKGEDERLADKIAPPASTLAWSLQKNRASESEKTVVAEGDPLLKAKPDPGENWLSQATGTKPIPNQ